MTLRINENEDTDDEIVVRMQSGKEECFGHNVRKYVREYTEVTGIHGLRYVTEKRTRIEKLVWAVLLLLSLAGCIYMIYEILYKYKNSPVVVSFATEDTPTYQIPFPAITICPEAKYSRDDFNYSQVYKGIRDGEKIDPKTLKTFEHLNLLCNEGLTENKNASKIVNEDFFETIDNVKLFRSYLLPFCFYDGVVYEGCNGLFTPVITDQGICYSFNIFSREEIYKPHVYHYEDYSEVENKSKDFFDIETGYKANSGVRAYPRRVLSVGAEDSFVIMLSHNLNDTDFFCNQMFQGFRVLVHNPWQVPRLTKHYFRIPLGKVVLASIEPEMIETSQTVRRFHPDKRKCFMSDERPLEHFNFYTQSNCLLECLTSYTLQKCGCVGFYMPRNNKTAICGPGNEECMEQAENELRNKEIESKISGTTSCDCKPSCMNLKFNLETSHSTFYVKQYYEVVNNMKIEPGFEYSILQIYFKDEQFMTKERNELYGITDLISNLGGLLGLFTGFSLISLLEIIYFCSLRPVCNKRMYGDWTGPPG